MFNNVIDNNYTCISKQITETGQEIVLDYKLCNAKSRNYEVIQMIYEFQPTLTPEINVYQTI